MTILMWDDWDYGDLISLDIDFLSEVWARDYTIKKIDKYITIYGRNAQRRWNPNAYSFFTIKTENQSAQK